MRPSPDQPAQPAQPPFRKLNWLPRDIDVQRRADGVIVLKSRFALQPYEVHIPALLARWALSYLITNIQ